MTDEQKRREAVIAGLHAMANFLEAFPQVEAPHNMTGNIFISKEDLPMFARLTTWEKAYFDEWFALSKDFGGGVKLDLNIARGQVCRKVVKGTRIVPAVEATPEHVEAIMEWVCDDVPLLALKSSGAA